MVPVFQAMTEWTFDAIHDAMIGLAEANGLKNGRIMWPVRVAVSGKPTTPGGAVELCQILGKEGDLGPHPEGHRAAHPPGVMARVLPVIHRKKTQNAMAAPSVLGRRRCFALLQPECKTFSVGILVYFVNNRYLFCKVSTLGLTVLIFVL